MKTLFARFVKDESGATAIEYGLIAGIIAVGLVVFLQQAGTALQGTFQAIAAALPAA